jgi:hypothetical protein
MEVPNMMVDDVSDSEADESMLAEEAVWQDRVLPELEWDETDELRVVEQLLGRSSISDEAN